MYPPESPYKVYCPECWWSDKWDPYATGRDYDFSRPFFEQLNDLWLNTPLLGLSVATPTMVNSDYNNHAGNIKNCYLLFYADYDEDCNCGFYVNISKNTLDSSLIYKSEFCYDCMNSFKNNRCVGLRNQVAESLDCYFLRDSSNCQNCFGSANLRNQKYVLFNQKYSREEYLEKIKEYDLGSYKKYREAQSLSEENWKKFPPMPYCTDFITNSTGNYLFESKNCQECYEAVGAIDSKYLLMLAIGPNKNCYDITSWGNNIELCYEGSVIGENASNVKFSHMAGINLIDAEYCNFSFGGANQFASVSAKKGKFVIFNKRYPEKEYWELRERIIKHMGEIPYIDNRGLVYKYGEFFPTEMSPWSYNETLANEFFPLEKQEAETKGHSWRDENKTEYAITLPSENLPDHIKDANESVLNEVIGCSKCGRGFKIIRSEFNFLKQMNLPLPRECPFCRIGEKFKKWVKNLTLVDRVCSKCSDKFRSSYTEEEYKNILCKNCYLKEII
ncbi:MAG: hypothetical protein AAB738_00160 [Patescibacteria group bacterium]